MARFKVGDTVVVIAGNSKGLSGDVTAINHKKQTATVSKLSIGKKHRKGQSKGDGSVQEFERPIHLSNLMSYDASSEKVAKGSANHTKLESEKKNKPAKKKAVAAEK